MLHLRKYTLQIKISKTSVTPKKSETWCIDNRNISNYYHAVLPMGEKKNSSDERLLKGAYKAKTNSQHFWEMVVESRYSG